MKKILLTILFLLPSVAFAATGDISAIRIVGNSTVVTDTLSACNQISTCNGWVAEIDMSNFTSTSTTNNMGIGANGSATNAKIVFTVQSPGYNSSAVVATTTRTIYGTQIIRLPYPNNAFLDEVIPSGKATILVALSDYIYPGESVTVTIGSGIYTDNGTGGTGLSSNATTSAIVTNNSTFSYPSVIGRWAWPGYEKVTGDFPVEAVAFDRFSENGSPIAAMVFTATDQHSHTAYATSTTMTKSTRTGDVHAVQVYAGTIPVSALTQGDVITVNFKAYPWIGTSSSILNSDLVANGGYGVAQPNEALGPLYEVNDKSGTYGTAYAIVDATNGHNSYATTWISTTQSAAESAYATDNTVSYANIGAAAGALKAYNNANYGRNEPGGDIIELSTTTNEYPYNNLTEVGTQNTWLTIQPLSTLSSTTAKITSGDNSPMGVQMVKFSGITIQGASTGEIRGTDPTDILWLDNDIINMTGTASIYHWQTSYATRNAVINLTSGFFSFSSVRDPFALLRGNNSTTTIVSSQLYCVLGNNNIDATFQETGNGVGQAISDNAIFAFNTNYGKTEGLGGSGGMDDTTVITKGVAFVQNVLENLATQETLAFAADSTTATSTNIILWNNTFTGSKLNMAYNEYNSVSASRNNWSLKGNLFYQSNLKTDTFGGGPPNTIRTGNWGPDYGVGFANNLNQNSLFPFDFGGINVNQGSTTGVTNVGYVSDQSYQGTNLGNGNYHLVSTSTAINFIPSGQIVIPYDLDGNVRLNDGTGAVGVYEFIPSSSAKSISQMENDFLLF